jgi:NAD(P)-dependent dehydrogenase (short-subunit alcohol dehydrogenase family)
MLSWSAGVSEVPEFSPTSYSCELIVIIGSGIGKACALLFAKEGAAGVMVADLVTNAARDVVAECGTVATNSKFHAEAVQVDITQEDSVKTAVSRMVQLFGRVDYCVNCAGVSFLRSMKNRTAWLTYSSWQIGVQQGADIVDMPLADFQRFLDINTTGMFLVTREASAAMRAQEPTTVSHLLTNRGTTRGAIVNLGSASSMVAAPGVLPYTASKHAALGLTKNAGEGRGF